MGQQQLLLLVLGIVIVGIAILVGINAYSENSVKSNWDSLLQDALRIASDAQSWKSKPELFGGSLDTTKVNQADFVGIDFLDLAYAAARVGDDVGTDDCYSNLNGTYTIAGATTGLTITGESVPNQNRVQLFVNGTLEANVSIVEDQGVKGGEPLGGGSATIAGTVCG